MQFRFLFLGFSLLVLVGFFSSDQLMGKLMDLISSKSPYSVRVAMVIDEPIVRSLDPALVQSIYQGMILVNIYGQLIEYDQLGKLIPGIAESFHWVGDRLILKIPPGRTVQRNGKSITATDAAVSLRRILKLGTASHFDLTQFLCDDPKKMEILDNCEGIEAKDDELVLRIRSKEHKSHLIRALATVDFGIIPLEAIDPVTLRIRDLTLTSGPYYLDLDQTIGRYFLRRNPKHYQAIEGAPQVIHLVEASSANAKEIFRKNEVDIVPTTFNIFESDLIDLNNEEFGFKLEKTLPIKLTFLQFSYPGTKKFSIEERIAVSQKVKRHLLKTYPRQIGADLIDIFQGDLSFGGLNAQQIKDLKSEIENYRTLPKSERKVSFYFYNQITQRLAPLSEIEELDLVPSDISAFMITPMDKRLDLALLVTDTGFEEDAGFLGYHFSQGTFGKTLSEGKSWMQKYFSAEDEENRSKMIQDLQLQALRAGILTPIMKAPYTALTRNGYTVELSPYFARTQFWRIRKEGRF